MKVITYDGVIDLTNYNEYLSSIRTALPPGALKFASDENHYNFYSCYCIHDLKFGSLIINESDKLNVTLMLKGNTLKHEKDLVLQYNVCSSLSISFERGFLGNKLSDVVIDEISTESDTANVVHEIKFVNGTLLVSCGDLEAIWKNLD